MAQNEPGVSIVQGRVAKTKKRSKNESGADIPLSIAGRKKSLTSFYISIAFGESW